MPAADPRVLVVEDDDSIRGLLVAALRREAFIVDGANEGAEALQLVAAFEYAVIVLDLMMPGVNGFDFLDAIHAMTPRPRSVVIVVTAFDDSRFMSLNAEQVHAVIRKPFDIVQFVAIVRDSVSVWTSVAIPLPATAVQSDTTESHAHLPKALDA